MSATTRPGITFNDIIKLLLAVGVSAFLAHYCVQIGILALGGHPNFGDFSSLSINGLVVSIMLLVGWAMRRVWLACVLLVLLGLCFLVPYIFVLKGPLNTWLMQVVTYVGLPTLACALFSAISQVSGVPMRPLRSKRRASDASKDRPIRASH